jgi:DNA mismatch endonuclease (patch repair protein)
MPSSNKEYWVPKLARNRLRDRANLRSLKKQGWDTMIVWECQTRNRDKLKKALLHFLEA